MKHLIYLNFHSNLKHSINQSQNDKNQLRNEVIDLLQHYLVEVSAHVLLKKL
jgi:hypothetical protein